MTWTGNKGWCRTLWSRISRRKYIETNNTKTVLNRYLTTAHLTFMGVGATVGVGIYVLIGVAAKDIAGPGLLISFVLAGMITVVNALMSAEFGSRIPTTGASYTYVYESMCEGLAFIVGWLMLLGYMTSGAIACRAWSGYFDSLFDGAIHNLTTQTLGTIQLGPPFSDHYDVAAGIIQIICVLIVAIGIHASANVNMILSNVSVSVLIFVTFMGFIYGDIENVVNKDHGGFMPFGFSGVIMATSSCFYAFQGFDVICMSAEESKTPHKSIPRAILMELLIVTVIYVGSSFGLIMLTPPHLINTNAPLPAAFEYRRINWAKYVVTIGPVLGIGNLILLNLYSTSRHLYCMSNDGLLIRMCAIVNKKAQVPLVAVVVTGVINTTATLVLDLSDLVAFNVLALFTINVIMSSGVLILRSNNGHRMESEAIEQKTKVSKGRSFFIFNFRLETLLIIIVTLAVSLGSLIVWEPIFSTNPNVPAVIASLVLVLCIIGVTFVIRTKVSTTSHDGFKVPFVPYLPVLNIVMNITILLYSSETWGLISFLVLVILGYVIYFVLIIINKEPELKGRYSKLEDDTVELLKADEIETL